MLSTGKVDNMTEFSCNKTIEAKNPKSRKKIYRPHTLYKYSIILLDE